MSSAIAGVLAPEPHVKVRTLFKNAADTNRCATLAMGLNITISTLQRLAKHAATNNDAYVLKELESIGVTPNG